MPQRLDDQNFWNFVYSLFFAGTFLVLMWVLYRVHGELPRSIALFDALLIVLATFRLIRLFVYDKITRFVRDWFVEYKEAYSDQGVTYLERHQPGRGPLQTASDLLACPWCFGVWAGLVVSFFYFLTPLAWFPIFVLAVSSLGTFLQLVANTVGWAAENGKFRAAEFERRGGGVLH